MNDQHTPDDDLRRLIHGAADGIRPQGTLDDILDRTKKVDPMARRWFLPVIAAAAVVAFVIGGAVWVAQDSNDPKGDGGSLGNNTPTPTAGVALPSRDVEVFYGGQTAYGWGLFTETHQSNGANSLDDALTDTMSGNPIDGDYQTLWPAGVTLNKAAWTEENDGTRVAIQVFLDGATERPNGMTERDAVLAIAAVVRTAHAWTPPGPQGNWAQLPVEFLQENDGAPPTKLTTLFGVTGPFTGGDDLDVMAPVQITSPSQGATLKAGTVKVEGVAAAFEANVLWEVKDGAGDVVKNSFATAQECCKLAPYSFTVDLEPGRYTIVVHDTDESGEGRPTNSDTKEIVVE